MKHMKDLGKAGSSNSKNLFLDIETGDPDDLFTLALMATHPSVNLKGVTVVPGGLDQIGLVKKVLRLVGRSDVLVGANVKDDGKARVGDYYRKWLGDIEPCQPDTTVFGAFIENWYADNYGPSEDAYAELTKIIEGLKDCHLLTGGPLSNIGHLQDEWEITQAWEHYKNPMFASWTCQGGFVGANIVPKDKQLPKFAGQITVPTFNLNGNPKAALSLLGGEMFGRIRMVGKNVCHGFIFNENDVNSLPKGKRAGLDLLIEGVKTYCSLQRKRGGACKKKPEGKAMHDILAAIMCIDPSCGEWVTGTPYREKGKWGFSEEGSVEALIGVDKLRALEVLSL